MQTGRIKKALAGLALATGSIVLATGSASAVVRPAGGAVAPAPSGSNPGWTAAPSIGVYPYGTNNVTVSGSGFYPNETVEVWLTVNSGGNTTQSYAYYPTASSGGTFYIYAWVGACTGASKTVTAQAIGYSQDRSNQSTTTVNAC